MTPTEIRNKAPKGATHYDIQQGNAIYYKVNNLGYTMRYDGNDWYIMSGGSINNYRKL